MSEARSFEIDQAGIDRVTAMLQRLRDAGLVEEADTLRNAYWGWIRLSSAYAAAHPYLGPVPIGHVDDAMNHWSDLIPGSPHINDEAVLQDAARDEAWHEAEARRMWLEACGEPAEEEGYPYDLGGDDIYEDDCDGI